MRQRFSFYATNTLASTRMYAEVGRCTPAYPGVPPLRRRENRRGEYDRRSQYFLDALEIYIYG